MKVEKAMVKQSQVLRKEHAKAATHLKQVRTEFASSFRVRGLKNSITTKLLLALNKAKANAGEAKAKRIMQMLPKAKGKRKKKLEKMLKDAEADYIIHNFSGEKR